MSDRHDARPAGHRRAKGGLTRAKAIFVAAVLAVGGIAVMPAEAAHPEVSLSGSNFEIDTNANLKVDDLDGISIDWANVSENRRTDTQSGPNDESFGNGTKEDTASPSVVTGGIPPNKSDLKAFGVYQEGSSSTGLLSLFWSRVQDPSGTTNMDFELNQKQCTPNTSDPDCTANGLTPVRTVNDKLITYDLSNGGTVATISLRTWAGNSWSAATNLSNSNDARGSVNTSVITAADSDTLGAQDPRTFGEAHIRLTALFGSGSSGCNAFGSTYLKSRSSDSFSSALKDFIPPANVTISNCSGLTIHKQDETGAALAGVQFQLYNDVAPTGGSRGAEDTLTNPLLFCTTNISGDCTIPDVPFGRFWVHEVAPPAGHSGAADQNVTISANQGTVTLTFVNDRNPASVSLHKENDLGEPMEGVTFTLYNNLGNLGAPREAANIDTQVNPAKSCTTEADGDCDITGILPVGNFWLVETTTPAGHDKAADKPITLGLGQNLDLTDDPFVNNRQPASVKLHKENDLGAAMEGVTFTLYNDFGTLNDTREADTIDTPVNPPKTCMTDSFGNCTITGILPVGNFWLVETTIPAGHEGADDRAITLGLGQNLDITGTPFVNTRLPASVKLKKVNDLGAPLAGATFTLYNDFGTVGDTREADTIDTVVTPPKTCTSVADGTCEITGILPVGNFWLVETNVPAGHDGADDHAITLGLDQDLDLTEPFVNPRQPASVKLKKVNDLGAAMEGVTFTLYNDFGTIGDAREDDSIDTPVNPNKSCTTAVGGTCTIIDILPVGNFWLVETTTPAGHEKAADEPITLGLGQALDISGTPFVNDRIPASVMLKKVNDVGAPLAGATFTLYNDFGTPGGTREAETVDTPVSPSKSCTTNGSGSCTIEDILPVGNFWLVETTTPAGHTGAADRAITLALDEDLDITASPFTNARQFRVVTFVCIDSTDTLHGSKVAYDGASPPDANNTPVAGGAITADVEAAICGLDGTAVHSGGAGAHSSSVSIP